jgi:peptidyl-prolyl cis-trans isomerase B (cyclophilin B)
VTRTALALTALLVALAGCSDDTEPSGSMAAAPDDSGCANVSAPAPKDDGGAEKPSGDRFLNPAKKNTVTFATSCGSFTVTLDVESAPATTASVAALAQAGFYDNTVFHRIVPGFVIQGGDPTGTGTGGPGYKTVDAPADDAKYTEGVVAMAKAGDEAAGTSGSQFFVVTAPDSGLPPDYAVIGTVTAGMEAVKRIESLGSPTEEPQRPVVINKATFAAK